MARATEMDDEDLKRRLTPLQYEVTQKGATERPGTGAFYHHKKEGTYTCIVCGTPLFPSDTKYDSGSGWPSFYAPVDAANVAEETDLAHGMVRTEIKCATCAAHLGHVFDDGPAPTGQRYCVNSASLGFRPKAEGANGKPAKVS